MCKAAPRKLPALLVLPVVLGLQALVLGSESPSTTARVAQAAPVEEAPLIDGKVDDDVWRQAEVITDFIQAERYEGEPATEKTEVRILYDDRNIYVGVVCYDSEPSEIIVTDARRDSNLDDTDSFRIIFDTYHDKQNGFIFGTNPVGIEYDAQVTNEGQGGGGGGGPPGSGRRSQGGAQAGFNLNWDTSFTVAAEMGEYGWSAEFAVPLRTLRYESETPQTWGLNFQRNVRRKREIVYWSPVSRIFSLNRVSSAGVLEGLELSTPRNFKVTPYALGSADRDFALSDSAETNAEWGADAKFGITPAMNLDLTYHTDFAQVEVDAQQVNLTRFNLFFPEKRPFFLENAGNFQMGQSQAVELFFSRRIGIGPGGEVVPILGGARLTGKVKHFDVGIMNMQTEDLLGVALPNNYTAASLIRELPNRSRIGALFVNRTATGDLAPEDDWNRTFGLDGKLGVGEAFTLTGFAARTQTPGLEGSDHSFNARAQYETPQRNFWLGYTEVGEDFNPEVGFLRRDNYRNLDTGWRVHIRPDIEWLRELRPHMSYRGFWDFDGFKETEQFHVDSHIDFESGAFFSPAFNRTVEGLQEAFEISDGIVVAPGTYQNWEMAWRWNTNQAATFSYSGGLDYGGFLSGDKTTIDTTLNYRLGSTIITSFTWSYNDVELLEGSFVTNLGQFRISYNFTPLIYLQAFVQYNDDIDTWSSNVRFSWLNTAGTGLFVVYNDSKGLGERAVRPAEPKLRREIQLSVRPPSLSTRGRDVVRSAAASAMLAKRFPLRPSRRCSFRLRLPEGRRRSFSRADGACDPRGARDGNQCLAHHRFPGLARRPPVRDRRGSGGGPGQAVPYGPRTATAGAPGPHPVEHRSADPSAPTSPRWPPTVSASSFSFTRPSTELSSKDAHDASYREQTAKLDEDPELEKAGPLVNIRPQHFTDAFLLAPIPIEDPYSTTFVIEERVDEPDERPDAKTGALVRKSYYVITAVRLGEDAARVRYWFDRVNELSLKRQQVYDTDGRLMADIRYSAYLPPHGEDGHRFASQVRIERPYDNYALVVNVKPDGIIVNRDLPDTAFVVTAPPEWTDTLRRIDLDKRSEGSP